jgi:hypothetical protein
MRTYFLVTALLLLPACSSSTAGDACPDAFPTKPATDGGAQPVGCHASAAAKVCEVGATTSCSEACQGGEQTVICTWDPNAAAAQPTPDPSFGCKVIAIPWPQGTVGYCCDCP